MKQHILNLYNYVENFYLSYRHWIFTIIYGIIAWGVFMVIFYLWITGYFEVISLGVAFADPSSSFSESLIRLYNFIWSFLIFILFLVLILMVRIMYLFSRNNKFFNNKIIQFFILGYYKLIILFSALVKDQKLIRNNLNSFIKLFFKKFTLNFWYSKRDKNEMLAVSELSEYKKLEIAWSAGPALCLISLISPSFSLVYSLDPYIDPGLTIKVVGHQWYWSYELSGTYPIELGSEHYSKTDLAKLADKFHAKLKEAEIYGNVLPSTEVQAMLNELRYNRPVVHVNYSFDSIMVQDNELKEGAHRLLEVDNRIIVPAGFPIRFVITSTDVLHSWSVPALGIKVDAVPGRLNQFVTEIKRPGVFYGQCSELCGPLHGFMPIVVQSVSEKEFEDWLIKKIS